MYFSSVKAVADQINRRTKEDTAARPGTPYGQSKRMAEEYILSHGAEGKSLYVLRPCMVHGPDNKGNLNLLHKMVDLGSPYPLGKFQNQRSFLYVGNLLFIIDQLISKSVKSGVYNLSDDGYLDTRDLIRLIAEATGQKARIWNWPAGLIRRLTAVGDKLGLPLNHQNLTKLTGNYQVSNEKIKAAIGASLPFTLEEGLKNTIAHFHGVDKV